MLHMMRHASVSVTITSATKFCAFAIASITQVPAVSDFCWYCAFGMIFDYINQMTFFISIVAFDIKRSEKGYGDYFGLFYCKPASKACCQGKYIYDSDGNLKPSSSYEIFTKYYGPFLMRLPVKIAVLTIFAGLLAMNAYGASQIDDDFLYKWFTNPGSYNRDTLEIYEEYYDKKGIPVYYYTIDDDFSSLNAQSDLV